MISPVRLHHFGAPGGNPPPALPGFLILHGRFRIEHNGQDLLPFQSQRYPETVAILGQQPGTHHFRVDLAVPLIALQHGDHLLGGTARQEHVR